MKRYRYFLLTLLVILADQVTKALVVKAIPLHSILWSFGGDFFRLVHVRNLGVAFSMGSNLPELLRVILLIGLPLAVLTFVAVYLVRAKDLTDGQRWVLALIVGGGLGNQIDRIFRPMGVVDFLDFKFYGLFGLERWPTFNIADSSVVIAFCLMFLNVILYDIQRKKSKKDSSA